MAIVTVTQALKKLYKSIVGEDTTKNNPTKIISELADNWSGGGGGAEPLIVNFDHRDTGTMISYYDKSWQEVYDAAKVGSNVVLINDDENIYTLSQIMDQLGNLIAVFGSGAVVQELTADSADGYLHSEPII